MWRHFTLSIQICGYFTLVICCSVTMETDSDEERSRIHLLQARGACFHSPDTAWKRRNGSDKMHTHTTVFLFRVRLSGSFPHTLRYGTEPLLLPTSFVAKDATTFSKLGSNSLVKVIIQNKIWMVYPVSWTAVCYVTIITLFIKKVGVVRPNFGCPDPRPLWLRPWLTELRFYIPL